MSEWSVVSENPISSNEWQVASTVPLQEEMPFKGRYPNVYAAGKTVADMVPYLKYIDPEERDRFTKLATNEQTRELLYENLNAVITLALPAYGKAISSAVSPLAERLLPKTFKFLTKDVQLKTPTVSKKIPEAPAQPAEVLQIKKQVTPEWDVVKETPIEENLTASSVVKAKELLNEAPKGTISAEPQWVKVAESPLEAPVKPPSGALAEPMKVEVKGDIVEPVATSGGKQPIEMTMDALPSKTISDIVSTLDYTHPKREIYKQDISDLVNRMKKDGHDFIDAYHVTDVPFDSLKKTGIKGSSLDYIGQASGNLRPSSVYLFLDPTDISKGYGGILGATAEINNVVHVKIPVSKLKDMYWDSNFNISHETYSSVRLEGNIPSSWVKTERKYSKGKFVSPEVMQLSPSPLPEAGAAGITGYHGTGNVFEKLEPRRGIHDHNVSVFTDNPKLAEDYAASAEFHGETQKGRVIEAQIDLKNPLIVDAKRKTGYDLDFVNKAIAQAKEEGRDGVIIKNIVDDIDAQYKGTVSEGSPDFEWKNPVSRGANTDYIVFDKGQITTQKEIWNRDSLLSDKSPSPLPEVGVSSAKDAAYETRRAALMKLTKLRESKPHSEAKRIGNNPTPEQKAAYDAEVKDWNKQYREANKAFKAADAAEAGAVSNSIIPEVKGGATGELPKYAEGSAINLERLNTTEDVRQFINQRTKAAEATIGKRTVTWEETRAQAELLGWDTNAIKKEWNRKGSFTAAEIDATRQTNLNAQKALLGKIKNIPYDQTSLSPELRAETLDAIGLVKITSQAASESGRALNMHKRVLSNDPEFRATAEFNRALNAIAGKGAKRTDDLIGRLKSVDFSDPAAVNKFVYDATKTKWQKLSDGAFEFWINGLLSNPLTHIVNTTSNALTLAYTVPERLLATGIESVRAKVAGVPKEMFFGEAGQEIFAVSKGLQDGVKRFAEALRTGDTANKLDYRPTALPDIIEKYSPARALTAEDAFFKGFIENTELNRLAFRQASKEGLKGETFKKRVTELLATPTEAMLEGATQRGKYLTYQKEMGKVGQLVFKARDTVPGLKYFIPFVKTPTNIAKFALERSPLYLPIAISKAIKGELKGTALSEQLAKPLMGTMLGTTIYQLAEQGYITGGQAKQAGERNEKLATGWQPYSVKIDDKYYSFGRLEPLGSILGMAADMSQIKTQMKEKEKFNLAAAIMGSITTNISNKTFMQGFTNMIQGISDPGRYGENIVKSLVGSVIPSVSGGLARSTDPNIRDTQSITDTLQSRIPVASKSLPPRLTVWGEPIERTGTPVGRFLSPIQVSKEKGSPIEKEMTRLNLDIGYPSRKVGGVELGPDEYWQMVKQGGQPAKIILDALSQSTEWKAKPTDEKEHDIRMIINNYRKTAHKEMVINLVKTGRLKTDNEKDLVYIYNQLK